MFFHEIVDQEVHVELIHKSYERLLKWSSNYPNASLMLLAKNDKLAPGLCVPCHNNGEAEPYYMKLKELPNPLGLHMHIAQGSQINSLPYEDQRDTIEKGIQYLERLGIHVKDFAPGWWNYNNDTVKACVDLGLPRFHSHTWFLVKNQVQLIDGVTIVKVDHNTHDFMLAS